jgi:hypothetical protein
VKRLTFAAFIAFWAFVGALLAIAALAPEEGPGRKGERESRFSLSEVALHGDARSCWMAIEGKVYDVTGYLGRHPTPDSVLLAWCGRDATVGMRTKGHGRDHSAAAWARLSAYQVGVLD